MPDRPLDPRLTSLCEQVEKNDTSDHVLIHGDSALFKAMAQSNFRGALYDRFEHELSRYGVGVLRAWISTGYIFTLTGKHGWSLHPSDRELEELKRSQDTALSLAGITVTVALKKFHSRALVGGEWEAGGGASLKTYFMGTVVGVFPNEFRKYRKESDRAHAMHISMSTMDERDLDEATSRDWRDPSDAYVEGMDVVARIAEIGNPRLRAMVALRVDGWSLPEIAEVLGEERVRAIEGCLYRWRNGEHRRAQDGGDRDGF